MLNTLNYWINNVEFWRRETKDKDWTWRIVAMVHMRLSKKVRDQYFIETLSRYARLRK